MELLCLKHILRYAAHGAYEIIGDIVPLGARSNTDVGSTLRLIIGVATNGANILSHNCSILSDFNHAADHTLFRRQTAVA